MRGLHSDPLTRSATENSMTFIIAYTGDGTAGSKQAPRPMSVLPAFQQAFCPAMPPLFCASSAATPVRRQDRVA